MRSFLSVVGVLACAGVIHSIGALKPCFEQQSKNVRSRAARQSETRGFRAMTADSAADSIFADSTFEVYDDSGSFEDFPRRTRSQQQGSPLKIDLGAGILGAGISPLSPSEQPEQHGLGLKPLQKRAPATPISERLALRPLTPLAERLSLKTGAAAPPAAIVVVAEPEIIEPEPEPAPVIYQRYPTVRIPDVAHNSVVWDRAELAKLNPSFAAPVVEVIEPEVIVNPAAAPAPVRASPAALAERRAALDALVQGRKSEFLEKRAQFDTTYAQKKAVLQAEGGFDKNSLLGKYSSLLKKKSEE